MKYQNKLVKIVVSSLLGASLLVPSAWGLGLGQIDSDTKLNESLKARIKLLSSKEFSPEDLTARIASYEAYGKFGVSREAVHGQFKFEILTESDGSKYIEITSSQAIKEPFLNFLVELNWPQGRLLREYTVLLDPPSVSRKQQQTVAVDRPTEARPVTTRVRPKPVERTVDSVNDNRSTKVSQKPKPKPKQPRVQFSGDNWRVGRGETLWSIAKRLRPEGTTVPQTLAALYRNNPSAFVNNDIDRLKAGANLKVPSRSQIDSISSSISYLDLKSGGGSEAPLDVRKTVSETSTVQDTNTGGRLTISSVTESELTDTSGANVKDGAEGDISKGSDELLEVSDSLSLDSEQLQNELESVNTDNTTGVALEDETLSVISGSAQAKDSEDEALQALVTESAGGDSAENKVTPIESKTVAPTTQPKEKSFWQKWSFWKWPLIILSVLAAAFGAFFVLKKRREELEQDLFADDVAASTNQVKKEQPSFNKEAEMVMPEIDTNPLDEADILIARGKLNEVEKLLLSTLKKDPSNDLARVKLMEVYSASEQADKLKAQFSLLSGSFDHDSEIGLKVAALMQMHQGEALAEQAEIKIEDTSFLSEEEVFGDPNLDLSDKMDEIHQVSDNLETDLEEAADLVEHTIEDSIEEITEESVIEFVDPKVDSIEQDLTAELDNEDSSELSEAEAHTKLELAKAYISMGDDESAVEILKEVKKEGSAEQRQVASQLLAEL